MMPTLKQLLINDLPAGFVCEVIDRLPTIYKDSFLAVTNDSNLGDEQAKYVMGYLRRGYAEALLERAAVNHGLKSEMVQPGNGGCKHIKVSVGKFSIVTCHVQARAGFPTSSENRVQASSINEFLSQMSLFPIDSNPEIGKFFAILVHTEVSSNRKDSFGSVYIGFPNHDFSNWIEEPIDLMEIRDLQIKNQINKEQTNVPHKELLKLKKTAAKIENKGAG